MPGRASGSGGPPARVFEIDPDRPDHAQAALAAAAEALRAGGLVVFPTETVYGLAARPDLPEATGRVFDAKGRSEALNLPVLVPSPDGAWEVAVPTPAAERLASVFWPGPLTLVVPRTEASRPWRLGERRDTVAVRVPDHPLTLALLRMSGPLAATSANPSGRPPLSTPASILATFGRTVAVVLLLASGAPPPSGVASTVVDAIGPGVHILRPGGIAEDRIRAALAA